MPPKNWDTICAGLSSPESSDAEDEPNVRAVYKNARRVSDLLHGVVPGLDRTFQGAPPKGMNDGDVLRTGLATAVPDILRSCSQAATSTPAPSTDNTPAVTSPPPAATPK